MHIGFSHLRLSFDCMPMHPEVREFAEKLAEKTGYRIVNEAPESRVVLVKQVGEAYSDSASNMNVRNWSFGANLKYSTIYLMLKHQAVTSHGKRRKRTVIPQKRRQIPSVPPKRLSGRQHVPIQRLRHNNRQS